MGLPDRLTDAGLQQEGFVLVSPGRAKHERSNSYRNKCDRCGLWAKEIRNASCKSCRVQ